ncbi:hypothetical protein MMC28_002725 [Mycoblastus sanguinarius]|nr:hypothetical protein [Mycoblastus sanguinarius]
MAAEFLKRQLAIPADELPADERLCTICTCKYGAKNPDGTVEYVLQFSECKHKFGSNCIETWLKQSNECPLCRRELYPGSKIESIPRYDDDASESGSEGDWDSEDEEMAERRDQEAEALEEFEREREPTVDELDEFEATGSGALPFEMQAQATGPETRQWRLASTRRRGALADRALYQQVRERQLRDGTSPVLPFVHRSQAILDWEDDRALFEYLRGIGAFRQPGMDIERLRQIKSSDEEIYEYLRNQGAKWVLSRNGWYLFGRRMVFAGIEVEKSEEEKRFEELQEQGAFRTLGINFCFRDVREPCETPTDWDVYQRILQDGATWDRYRETWINQLGYSVYGDIPIPSRH